MVRRGGSDARAPRVASSSADLEDGAATEAVFEPCKPDRIVHLAGQSSVHRSWENPAATLRATCTGS